MKKSDIARLTTLILASATLFACGGGGSDSSSDLVEDNTLEITPSISISTPEVVQSGSSAVFSVDLEAVDAPQSQGFALGRQQAAKKATLEVTEIHFPTIDGVTFTVLDNDKGMPNCWLPSQTKNTVLSDGESCKSTIEINSQEGEVAAEQIAGEITFSAKKLNSQKDQNLAVSVPISLTRVDKDSELLAPASELTLGQDYTFRPNETVKITVRNDSDETQNYVSLKLPGYLMGVSTSHKLTKEQLLPGQSYTFSFTLDPDYYQRLTQQQRDELDNNLQTQVISVTSANAKTRYLNITLHDNPLALSAADLSLNQPGVDESSSLVNSTDSDYTIDDITLPEGVFTDLKKGDNINANSARLIAITLSSDAEPGDMVIHYHDEKGMSYTTTIALAVDNTLSGDDISLDRDTLFAFPDSSNQSIVNSVFLMYDGPFNLPLGPGAITLDGVDGTIIQNSDCFKPVLKPGEGCLLTIVLPPQADEAISARLNINSTSLQSIKSIPLSIAFTDIAHTIEPFPAVVKQNK
ncbi:MAG: hypothetical protein ACO2ZM_02250, partial [Francisellaceae bacterium]